MRRKALFAMTVLLILGVGPAVAGGEKEEEQGDAEKVRMEEMVVTATRTKTKEDLSPASVSVVSKEDMQRLDVETIDEVLKYQSGVYVDRANGLVDPIPEVSMRGLPGQDRTLMLLNGLPLNDGYTGGVDLNTISTENVERIEVIRGPASALYGGNAMGGVINIITRKPMEFEGDINIGYGSNDRFRSELYVGDRLGDSLSLGFSVEQEKTEGFPTELVTADIESGAGTLTGGYGATNPEGDKWWIVGDSGDQQAARWNTSLNADYDLSETTAIGFDFQHGVHTYDYQRPHTFLRDTAGNPAFQGKVDLEGGATTELIEPADFLAGEGKKKFSNYALTFENEYRDLAVDAKLGMRDRNKWYTSADAGYYDDATGEYSDATTHAFFADIQADYFVSQKHLLTFGMDYRQNRYEDNDYGLSFYRNRHTKTGKLDITRGKDRSYAAYVQDKWSLLDDLRVYGGLRFDKWRAYDGESGGGTQYGGF